jgi:Tol biopolymer transport system component
VDPSHDGKSLAFFRLASNQIELVRTDRDGGHALVISQFPKQSGCHQPRWSPNDSAIAFIVTPDKWVDDIFVVPSSGGSARQVTHDARYLSGFSWLSDSSGFVYSSPRDETLLYLPRQHLWRISLDGSSLQQLTFGDEGDESPDIDAQGRIAFTRSRIAFDIWKIPMDSSPAENVRRAVRITRQTSEVQTPSLSPDNRELVYLSDTGGHGNLWVLDLQSQQARQITFERDPKVTLGVPVWSPDGSAIAYVRNENSEGLTGINYWVIHPDGSDNRYFLKGSWFSWSWDSHWAYYSTVYGRGNPYGNRLMKKPLPDGPAVEVRSDLAVAPALSPDDSTLYYLKTLEPVNGLWDYEIRAARPETAPSTLLGSIRGSRVPMWQGLHPVISPDGKWLALTLNDKFGTNLWLLSTETGEMHPVTDFGDRHTFIARHVSWSSDNKYIFAAVGDGNSDIVLLDGLLH